MSSEEKAKVLIKALVKLGIFKHPVYYIPPDGSKPIPMEGWLEMRKISRDFLERKLALALRVKANG